MSSSVLAVPIHLDALVVPSSKDVNSNLSTAWSQVDYSQLSAMQSPLATLNDIGAVPGPDKTRVVLHWSLPDALTRGDYSGAPTFPKVPDRWLVARFEAGGGEGAVFWVIEGDYIGPVGASNFLDPSEATTPTSVATTKIGRRWTIDAWEQNKPPARAQPFLTAVGPGNVAFAAFAPHCEDVFAFIDDSVVEGSRYTYAVVGWHADPREDPLAKVAAGDAKAFAARLVELQWALASEVKGAAATSTRYHAQVRGVDTGQPATARTPPNGLRIVVGNTAVDALAKLVELEAADHAILAPENGSAWALAGAKLGEVIQALGYDRVDTLEKVDAGARLAMETRDHWYGSEPGGLRWAVIPERADAPSLTAAQQSALDRWLAGVNAAQRQRDAELRELRRQQAELYALWWKSLAPSSDASNGSNLNNGTGPSGPSGPDGESDDSGPAGPDDGSPNLNDGSGPGNGGSDDGSSGSTTGNTTLLAAIKKELDPSTAGTLAAKVWALAWSLSQPSAALPPARGELSEDAWKKSLATWADGQVALPGGAKLSAFARALVAESEPRFYHPGDPVVLIKGLGRSRRHGEDGRLRDDRKLACRLGDQLLAGRDVLGARGWIPALCGDLLAEAAAIDAGGHPAIPPADFATAPWTQAWSPLFLEWQLRYYPTTGGLAKWSFDGDRFHWQGTRADVGQDHVFGGRIVLTPQVGALFGRRVAKLLKDSPTLAGSVGDHLNALVNEIDGWDILSQTLAGFTDKLLTRSSLATFPPPGAGEPLRAGPGGATPSLGALIGEQYHLVPWLERGAPFAPLRAGFGKIEELRVIDAFSQRQDLLPNPVYRADALVPDHPESLEELPSGSELFALPPRLAQATRLSLRFLGQGDGDPDLAVAPAPDPVCGWLVPNHLDSGLAVYDGDGRWLGEVDTREEGAASVDGSAITDATLKAVVAAIAGHRDDLGDLLQTIDETLWLVDPLGARKDAMMSVLIGRPLAVVRARLSLELDGPAAVNESKTPTSQDDGGVTKLTFGVRLGDAQLRDDGLLGYFIGDDYDTFYAVRRPFEAAAGDTFIKAIAPGDFVGVEVDGPGVVVTMILDPRAGVHASSGVLPVVRAELPQHELVARARRLKIRFAAGPILAPPGEVAIPRPGEPRGAWSFLLEEGAVPIVDADKLLGVPHRARVLHQGWLELDPEGGDAGE